MTGGSAGLGLALAILLTKKGADVSIVARNKKRLQDALDEMKKVRQTPNQVLKIYSFSLSEESSSTAAFDAACNGNGRKCPDAVFLCAGSARPGFFIEEDETSLRQGMDNAYWVQAWSALVSHLTYSAPPCSPLMKSRLPRSVWHGIVSLEKLFSCLPSSDICLWSVILHMPQRSTL